jgi:hypothetical protein
VPRGTIAFSYAHGEEIDWEKVGSSHGRSRAELKVFFEKAKKFAPAIVAMISPSAASAASSTPVSSTPATNESVPPPNTDTSSAADREAEVA